MMKHTTKVNKAQKQQKAKKPQYGVRNWGEYNASLVKRGSITVWVSTETTQGWRPQVMGVRSRGGQMQYTDAAIECSLTLKELLGLALRQTEGFVGSVLELVAPELKAPDYTTLCKRAKEVKVNIPVSARSGPAHIVMDSTGMKVYGEGEWKVRKHGYSKRRTWRKVHLSVNPDTQEVEAVLLTEVSGDDAGAGGHMLQSLADPIESLAGDGAYDKRKFYETCTKRQIRHILIPPQHNARIWQHGNSKQPPLPRDQNLRRIRKIGRKGWKVESGYHRRSLAETAVFRFKTIFGGHLSARSFERQITEVRIKCRVLNIMTQLGMPDSYLVVA